MLYSPRGEGNQFDGGAMIKRKLQESYLTQRQLSDSTGISCSKISDIIRGFRRPNRSDIMKIQEALNIDMAEWREESESVRRLAPALTDIKY